MVVLLLWPKIKSLFQMAMGLGVKPLASNDVTVWSSKAIREAGFSTANSGSYCFSNSAYSTDNYSLSAY
jgi:hypothetical protein